MQDEQIHLVDYDPTWPDKFEKEKKLIEETIDPWIVGGIHHVGSTAIPGLSAKPIIDIMAGVKDLEAAKPCIKLLKEIDYCHYPYKPTQMIWFCKPSPEHRTHHLYLMVASYPEWKARLAFRDYLRNHNEAKEQYEELKINLVKKFSNDREAYTQSKEDFVRDIVSKALGDNE